MLKWPESCVNNWSKIVVPLSPPFIVCLGYVLKTQKVSIGCQNSVFAKLSGCQK